MLLPFAPPIHAHPTPPTPSLEARLDDVIARVREQRPSVQALHASMALIEELQALRRAEPSRYDAVITPRCAVLPLWLMQLALIVSAAGLPSQGRALLQALPGVSASSFVQSLVAELIEGDAHAPVAVVGGVA